ncbi:glycine dehydrogenase subunit 1 [Alkalihalobacillus alcalophilus ATCC 27647 = CGMCC 1.3604]|uniref:Probable glycine dehydrogenase (decarboxylating) subunit 1 n=1 Tax=Alkalihalobacillus alcalophilus ATCC 27647 = CGMCC 1.3604 TaxID=1218173 RepID=A0A094WDS3_ALKAL|nr:aminomethyl-transferring glycine dehydrogenase subunit GcvPA [Alkalihalobacillus alcalophilus]KGA95899.1 glycine dehydrogenase [Alkalihalobacillus alcalophilus ATCC 27647 = CGMCC 1.3604]MED1562888.1 aminomethyl-transferring glycine dehydrogenase subunit GcvPA [Alkalihalobacillus alcalophilus]THG90657.1 glycine dehydrogenase subunit 1 [Alkalihalobacillus alcalophilus ATCC 27647 = CGMCC 1.3604]
MNNRYLPMTETDKQAMLETIGVDSIEELFSDIPESIRFKGQLNVPESLREQELLKYFNGLANKNVSIKEKVSFLGAGVYEHYIPSIVDHVISRSEFYTAYTPYQPEISQGELQAIFEFQTMICELTGMDIANSSMYDGPTALAEAAMMSAGHTKNKTILVSKAVHPEARAVIQTNAKGQRLNVIEIDLKDGVTDLDQIREHYNDDTACVVVQYPNFFGHLEPLAEIEKIAHEKKAMMVVSSNPLSLGLLKPPGHFGADIVVGDAQPFGIATQFGGPHCGYFAVTKKLMRKLPGRLVGQTKDEHGQRGFVLTLQAREQHIRREKATSNICSNQALNALAASVAMTAIGKKGVKEMAYQNVQKAGYAKAKLKENGVTIVHDQPVFNEFIIQLNAPVAEVNQKLLERGIIGGYDLSQYYPELENCMLVTVTEIRTKEEINQFAKEVGALQ